MNNIDIDWKNRNEIGVMQVKVSDYVMNFIAGLGVDKIFFVSGGGAMHLNNSLGESEQLQGICMLHEQGAGIAAEAYARVRDGFGACLVTSGPGATNALTALAGAFIDSIPVIFISGQAKRDDLRGNTGVRQFGIQEVDIISMASSYSKYAVQISKPEDIRRELEKAAAIASEGRPGPVWLDIPLDIQASQVEPELLQGYEKKYIPKQPDKEAVSEVIRRFNKAKRPVIMLGHGIRLAHAIDLARELYSFLGVPVLTSWNGVDLIEEDHPLFFGRPGSVGHRSANFIQQKADFILTIGTRLCLLNTGYNFEGFLSNAYHAMVDIDEAELNKKSVHPQLKIPCDAGEFIRALLDKKDELKTGQHEEWLNTCRQIESKYPKLIPEQRPREGYISNYDLISEVSSQMTRNDIYQFTSSGTTVDIGMKMYCVKWGQRAFLNKGMAAMGYDIPASIGSCIGSNRRRVICVTGDGSAAMNIQELEVMKRLGLPIKLFISDNGGYSMIYTSQYNNFNHNLTGCTKESGLTLPDMGRVAEAFGIQVLRVEKIDELQSTVVEALRTEGPVVCVVKTDITQKILPRQANYMKPDGQMASYPIEDMAPLLERTEYNNIMNM